MNAKTFDEVGGLAVVLLMVCSFIYAHNWIKEEPKTPEPPTSHVSKDACINRAALLRPGDIMEHGHIQGLVVNNNRILACQ